MMFYFWEVFTPKPYDLKEVLSFHWGLWWGQYSYLVTNGHKRIAPVEMYRTMFPFRVVQRLE